MPPHTLFSDFQCHILHKKSYSAPSQGNRHIPAVPRHTPFLPAHNPPRAVQAYPHKPAAHTALPALPCHTHILPVICSRRRTGYRCGMQAPHSKPLPQAPSLRRRCLHL